MGGGWPWSSEDSQRSSWSLIAHRAVVVAASVAVLGCLAVATAGRINAQTLPFCGGQNAPPQPVPYTCKSQVQTIDGRRCRPCLEPTTGR